MKRDGDSVDAGHGRPAETRSRFDYAPDSDVGPPRVCVVTLLHDPDPRARNTGAALLGQSFQPWVWLVVGAHHLELPDVSPTEDPRIELVSCADGEAPAVAANRAVSASGADYVLRLEAGDLLEPTALEKWFWYLESHTEHAFVDSHASEAGEGGRAWTAGLQYARTEPAARNGPGVGLVRRTTFEGAGGFRDQFTGVRANWDLWRRCGKLRQWGGTLPEMLVRRAGWEDDLRPSIHPQEVPQPAGYYHSANAWVTYDVPCANHLRKVRRRLLLIVPWMALGGADQFNLALLDQLTPRGWEVSVASTLAGQSELRASFDARTPDVFALPNFLRLTDYPRFLAYLVRSRGFDVVAILNSEFGYRLLPYLRSSCPDPAYIDFCHSEIETWNNGGYPRFSVEYQSLLDLTITSSEHLRRWMVKRGADGDAIEVCGYNVDSERFRPDPEVRARTRRELGIDETEPVILVAARLAQEKQPLVLADVLKGLHEERRQFTALIAGDGPYFPWLERFARRQRLGAVVRLLGATPHDRVADLMCASDVFFLPSRWEGIALTLYEAMASGAVPVAADVGGQAELVTPDCGVLVPRSFPDDEARLYKQAIAGLLDDPERRRAMARAARERVSREFRLEDMGERMHDLLLEGVRRHGQSELSIPVGAGRVAATEAVEYTRALDLANYQHALLGVRLIGLRSWIVAAVDRVLGPVYRLAIRRGVPGLKPLKERIQGALVPGSFGG